MTRKENKSKAPLNISRMEALSQLMITLESLEHSDYEVTPQGKLCYKKLIGLELNAVAETSIGLIFGYES